MLYLLALHAFLVAAVLYITFVVNARDGLLRWAGWFSLAGFALDSLGLVDAHVSGGSTLGPAGMFYSMMAWSTVGFFHLLVWKKKVDVLGVIVLPLAVLFNSLALLSTSDVVTPTTPPIWVSLHVAVTTWGEALFALAAASGTIYVYQDWRLRNKQIHGSQYLPDLQTLDALGLTLIRWGFFLLTLGVGSGVAAALVFDRPQLLSDPISMVFKVTWGLYLALLLIRAAGRIGGRRSAILNIGSFTLALVAMVTTFLMAGGVMHAADKVVG